MYPNHMWAWRISKPDVLPPRLLTEKNAADVLGERNFMFGFKSLPTRVDGGIARDLYDDGVLLQVPVSYTKAGPYAMCNTDANNNTYHCTGSSPYVGIKASSTGEWYSFPEAGENLYWHQGDCPLETVTLPVKVVVDELASSGRCKCPKQGSAPEDLWKACAVCIVNLSDATYTKVFTQAFARQTETRSPLQHVPQMIV